MWPPQSPDLAPLDFSIWCNVEKVACATPHSSIPPLKASVKEAWTNMSTDLVIATCKAFCPCIEAMLVNDGGLIELIN